MYWLDTNILIVAINERRPDISRKIRTELDAESRLIVSSVVRFELEYGIAKSDRRTRSKQILEEFLRAGFETSVFDTADAVEAGDIRAHLEARGTPIGPYDILLAAQVRRRRGILVTLNRREFERVPGLMVTDWQN